MARMIGHLGTRVSALLDGQLPAREAEEAWAHVYSCHSCRDLVEREGWIKTRLAGLDRGPERCAPTDLKGSLLRLTPPEGCPFGTDQDDRTRDGRRVPMGAVALGGGAIGAAMLGVLALGLAPGAAPPADRRPPATQINTPAPSGTSTPTGPDRAAVNTTTTPVQRRSELLVPLRHLLP